MTERLDRPVGQRIRDTTIRIEELIVLAPGERLVRVHALGGPHPSAWHDLRFWGPTSSRFDHQPPPSRVHPTRGIAYAAFGPKAFTAALAEFFQSGTTVGPFELTSGRPAISIIELTRTVTLLDLKSGWTTRAGGNQAISTGSRSMARDWARSIYRHHPEVDGLAYRSSVWGPGQCAALWERVDLASSQLVASRVLNDPALRSAIDDAADEVASYRA